MNCFIADRPYKNHEFRPMTMLLSTLERAVRVLASEPGLNGIDKFIRMREKLGNFFDGLDRETRFEKTYEETNSEYRRDNIRITDEIEEFIEDEKYEIDEMVRVSKVRFELLLKNLESKGCYPGIPQETANQLIFGILCYTYHHLSDGVKNILNGTNIMQSTELFGTPTRFIQHPAENDAILLTKQQVIECALSTNLHEFFHDNAAALPSSESELQTIFERMESELDVEIELININDLDNTTGNTTETKDQIKELLNKIVQDLKEINFKHTNKKTKRQFIFGVICYVYHHFEPAIRGLFKESIIADERILTELFQTFVQKFTGQSNQYAINSEDKVIACAVCNDLNDFFVKRGKYSDIICRLEEEFNKFVNECYVNNVLGALNLPRKIYDYKFTSTVQKYLTVLISFFTRRSQDHSTIIESLITNSQTQKFADQFIVGCLCFFYHQLNYKTRSSLIEETIETRAITRETTRAMTIAIFTKSSLNLSKLYHHIYDVREDAEPWLIKTKNRVIEFTFCDDVDAFFGRRPTI